MVVHRTPMVCCQGRNDTQQNFEIPAIIGQCYNLKISISALIDSGCLQTNIINGRVAQLLLKDGNAIKRQASRSLTSGVGGGIFEVNGLIDFDIRFLKPDGVEEIHSIYIRALISPDIRTDLIIGLPTIKKYNLLNLLQSHLDTIEHMCEVCADSDTPAQILSPTQTILINHIDTIADPAQLTNLNESELTEIVQRLHISEVFETEEDDEALEKTDITDILSQEAQGDLTVDIQGSILMTTTLKILVQKYNDIFSTREIGESTSVRLQS